MVKNCTSLEQSQKLIELGIDRKTSDMYYWCGEDLRIGGYRAQDEEYDIPAWSLTALLGILPNNEHISTILSRGGWKIEPFEYVDKWCCEYEDDSDTKDFIVSADNSIDACYEMVVKLYELKLI